MATEIDALQLNITAETHRAKDSIDKLAESLRKLGDSIHVFNDMAKISGSVDTFSTAMGNLSDSVSNVDVKQIKSVSSAVNSLFNAVKRVTDFKGTSGVGRSIKEVGQSLASEMGVKNTQNVNELTSAIRTLYENLTHGADNSTIKRTEGNIRELITAFSDFTNSMSASVTEYNKVRDYISKTPIKLPSDFYKEFGDDSKFLRGIFGIANTSNKQALGDVAELAREMNATLGTSFDLSGGNQDIFRQIAEYLLQGKKEAEQLAQQFWRTTENANGLNTAIDGVYEKLIALAGQEAKAQKSGESQPLGFANALYDLEGISLPDFSSLKVLADSITKLSGTNATAAGEALKSIVQGLKAFEGVTIPNIGDATVLAENLRMLGSKTIRGAGEALPKIVASLKEFNNVAIPQDKIAGLSELAKTLAIFGRQTSREAVNIIPSFATAFKNLIRELSSAPAISRNVIDLSNALGNFLANVRNVNGASRQASNGFKLFGNSATHAKKKLIDFGRIIGKFYAKWFLLLRLFGKLKQAINISSDLKEVQNVVDTTFGKLTDDLEEFATSAVENFGMSELSAKKYASRFQAMAVAMAIPAKQIEEAQQKLNTINPTMAERGYNDLADSMADMSINVTKLAADMASFYNVEQEDVAKDLEAIYTGMTRPLRQYGLDLTEATLKEWAMKNGLDSNIKSMTQAEKTLLRYQYVMANTSAAQGDFAKTSLTWANQIRMLKQNFERLGAVIGSGFIAWLRPMVVAVNNAMSSIIAAVQKVVNALGKIFGWEMIVDTTGQQIIDDTEDVSEAWDDATSAAKKYAKQLLGIDEINNLTTNDKGSGSGDTGAGAGLSGGNIIKPGGIEFKKFESDIDNLYDLGKKLSEAFANLLPDSWDEIYEKARNFGKGLADFLNGLIQPDTFHKLGKTIAGAIMTAITALASFSEEADWEQYGESLGEGINGFFEEFDGKEFADGVNKFAKGILEAIKKALKTVDWGEVWTDIVDLISGLSPETIALALGTITIKKVAGWVFGGGALKTLGSVIKKGIQDSLVEGTASGAAGSAAGAAAGGAAKKGFGAALHTFMTADLGTMTTATASWATIGATIITGIIGGAATAVAGWHFGQWLYEKITGDDTDYGNFIEQMAAIGESIVDGTWKGAVDEMAKDNIVLGEAKEGFNLLKTAIQNTGEELYKTAPEITTWAAEITATNDPIEKVSKTLETFGGTTGEMASYAIDNWDEVTKAYEDGEVWDFLAGKFSTVLWGGYGETVYNGLMTEWNAYTEDTENSSIWGFLGEQFSKNEWVSKGLNMYNGLMDEWNAYTEDTENSDIWGFLAEKFGLDAWTFDSIREGLSASFESAWKAVKEGWNNFADWLEGVLTVKFDDSAIGQGLKQFFGADEAKLIKLPRFAQGGFPNQGSLFVAGETYGQSEWVGNINGKTGVTSGYEITGIANAIYETSAKEMAMLRQQNEYLNGILNKEFGISRDAVGEAARSYAKEYNRRTGKQAYSF